MCIKYAYEKTSYPNIILNSCRTYDYDPCRPEEACNHGLFYGKEEMPKKKQLPNCGMQIPQEAFDRIAEVMLPLMQQYFESEEGKTQLEQWKKSLEQKSPCTHDC